MYLCSVTLKFHKTVAALCKQCYTHIVQCTIIWFMKCDLNHQRTTFHCQAVIKLRMTQILNKLWLHSKEVHSILFLLGMMIHEWIILKLPLRPPTNLKNRYIVSVSATHAEISLDYFRRIIWIRLIVCLYISFETTGTKSLAAISGIAYQWRFFLLLAKYSTHNYESYFLSTVRDLLGDSM